jgi:hypothetical protein
MMGKTKQLNLKILRQNESIGNILHQVYEKGEFLTLSKYTVCSRHA